MSTSPHHDLLSDDEALPLMVAYLLDDLDAEGLRRLQEWVSYSPENQRLFEQVTAERAPTSQRELPLPPLLKKMLLAADRYRVAKPKDGRRLRLKRALRRFKIFLYKAFIRILGG